jgi:hypothetical protein
MINAADRSFHRARTALIKSQAVRQRTPANPEPAAFPGPGANRP